MSSSSDNVTDRSIAKYCPELECVSLYAWKMLSGASMHTLGSILSLKEINLSRCSGLTSAGVRSLLSSIGAKLKVLTLSDFSSVDDDVCSYCDDGLLSFIGVNCPELRVFSVTISSDSTVTEASLIAIVRGCPLLRDFAFSCKKTTDTLILELADSCLDLQRLGCRYGIFSDVGLTAVINKCNKLEYLDLYPNPLENLKLTNAGITCIATKCRNFKEIHFVRLKLVTDTAFRLLFESCPNLTSFTLTYSPTITDCSLLALIRYSPGLQKLRLVGNKRITERSIATLITLYDLNELYITDCSTLSDDTVCLLARLCSKLNKVIMLRCLLVTQRALIELLTYSNRLTSLTIQECGIDMSASFKATHLAKRPSSRRLAVDLGVSGRFLL